MSNVLTAPQDICNLFNDKHGKSFCKYKYHGSSIKYELSNNKHFSEKDFPTLLLNFVSSI